MCGSAGIKVHTTAFWFLFCKGMNQGLDWVAAELRFGGLGGLERGLRFSFQGRLMDEHKAQKVPSHSLGMQLL